MKKNNLCTLYLVIYSHYFIARKEWSCFYSRQLSAYYVFVGSDSIFKYRILLTFLYLKYLILKLHLISFFFVIPSKIYQTVTQWVTLYTDVWLWEVGIMCERTKKHTVGFRVNSSFQFWPQTPLYSSLTKH